MPNIGDTCKAKELGFRGRSIYKYVECPHCLGTRWVVNYNRDPICGSCAAQKRYRKIVPVTYDGTRNPVIGDTTLRRTVGQSGNGILYYAACPLCGLTRWVRYSEISTTCMHCVPKHKSSNPRYDEPRRMKNGYVLVHIPKDDPAFTISNKGWIGEHRLIMSRHIGRLLDPREVVHHINGCKSDNRLENLKLLANGKHNSHMVAAELRNLIRMQERRIRVLESRVTRLETDNALLLAEVRDNASPNNLKLERYNTPGICTVETDEGIVHALGNKGEEIANRCSRFRCDRFLDNEHQIGVPTEQSMGKLVANSGKTEASTTDVQGIVNPELSGDGTLSPKCVETIYHPSLRDEEIVHPLGKPWDKGASQEPTQAALTQWRCENLPKRGTLNSGEEPEHGNLVLTPDTGRDTISGKCVETIQEALSEKSESDEIVHPSEKLEDYGA